MIVRSGGLPGTAVRIYPHEKIFLTLLVLVASLAAVRGQTDDAAAIAEVVSSAYKFEAGWRIVSRTFYRH